MLDLRAIAAGAALALLPLAGAAADWDDRFYLHGFGQAIAPDGDRDQHAGAGAGLSFGIPVTRGFAIEIAGHGYSVRQDRDRSLYDRGGMLGVDALFGRRDWFKHTLLILGTGLAWEDIQLEDHFSPYLTAGAGLALKLLPSGLAARVEVRGTAIFNDGAVADRDVLYDGSVRLGLELPLGDAPALPAPPPARPAVAPVARPSAPPSPLLPDADGDGVPDGGDRCPGTPPEVPVDLYGCPPDADRDGVADALDRCPDSFPGMRVDAAGCAVSQDLVLAGIDFAPNSAELTPEARVLLDRLARALIAQPTARALITGHTDNVGAQDYNLALSQRRAEAVREYLIRAGVEAARLTAEGYGEFQPIADNGTPAGRARNRRVELRLLAAE